MLSPALSPEHALPLTFPPTGRLPSTVSAADLGSALFEASQVVCSRPTPHLVLDGFVSSTSGRDPSTEVIAGKVRSPRFRRVPCLRDVASDPGRATGPRLTAPHMLPSTDTNASAPASSFISWLNPTPTRLLCTLRRGRHLPRRNTRYRAGATPYPGRTSTGWIAPASWYIVS